MSGNSLNQCCWKSSPAPPAKSYVLDDYPGSYGAYSLRKLSSTYAGPCVKVRRDDSFEADIGFVNDVIDTAALIAHCDNQNGFVSRWYDQSGSGIWGDAYSTTHGDQPQILSAGGVLYEWNGHPYIHEAGKKVLSSGFNILYSVVSYSMFSTGYIPTGIGGNMPGFTGANAGQWFDGMSADSVGGNVFKLRYTWATLITGTVPYTPDQFNLATGIFNTAPGDCKLFTNGVADGTMNTHVTPPPWNMTIYAYSSGNEPDWVEYIFYPSDVGSDRSAIETDIIDYYGI